MRSSRINNFLRSDLFFIIMIFLSIAIIYDFERLYSQCYMRVFQARDLLRAHSLSVGNPVFFGPEMTGGGNLFGPLYYIMLLPALLFDNSWKAGWWEMYILAFLTCSFTAVLIRRKIGLVPAILFTAFFLFNIRTLKFLNMYVNASFLYPFSSAAIIGAVFCFLKDEKYRERYFLLSCIAIGLGIQIHFSILPVLFALIFMQVFSERLGLASLSWSFFFKGMLLFIAPSVPYMIWKSLNLIGMPIGQVSPMIGEPQDITESFIYIAKNGVEFFNVDRAIYFFKLLYYSAPESLTFVLISILIFRKDEVSANAGGFLKPNYKRFITPLIVISLFILPQVVYTIVARIGARYGMVFQMSMMMLTPILILHFINSTRRQILFLSLSFGAIIMEHYLLLGMIGEEYKPLNWAIVLALVGFFTTIYYKFKSKYLLVIACLVVPVFVSFMSFDRHERRAQYGISKTLLRQSRWVSVLSTIYQATGWSYEVARRRIYQVNVHDNSEIERTYLDIQKSVTPDPIHPLPDGFIVAVRSKDTLDVPFLDWLKKQEIQRDLVEAIKKGDLVFGEPTNGLVETLPYYVKDTTSIPSNFHNVPVAYGRSDFRDVLDGTKNSTGVSVHGDNFAIFKWNECRNSPNYCDVGALVKYGNRVDDSNLLIELTVVGESLAQSSIWVHPAWTASLNEPYLRVNCGGVWSSKKILFSSIGYQDRYLHYELDGFFPSNNSVIAPFSYDFSIPCLGQLQSIEVGWVSMTIRAVASEWKIPGKVLTHFIKH